jgi:hypothetical protein
LVNQVSLLLIVVLDKYNYFFSVPRNGGLSPAAFAQSSLASLLSSPALNSFNAGAYAAESLTPILVDFPPLPPSDDYPQTPGYFPRTRSAIRRA